MVKSIIPKSLVAWRNWLEKNHQKEDKVFLIKYKKHTGKKILSNADTMKEAICFGWIDTTTKRLDEKRFQICYVKRNSNSKWSYNTLKYGEELIKEGRMSSFGLKMYKEGLKKKPHDYGIPKNPEMPSELKKALEKNKRAREKYEKLAPSTKKLHYRMILRAKRPETKEKRVKEIMAAMKLI
ncbi:YdeI/OmpD-associated family protein [Candidatus Woesearchaeota archaeon]|nr:YdeI/OmpD-associated family protein [Candidatus Woesearchaeota archaeon]